MTVATLVVACFSALFSLAAAYAAMSAVGYTTVIINYLAKKEELEQQAASELEQRLNQLNQTRFSPDMTAPKKRGMH